MIKRAVIYVRVSSERQAEKVSPAEQESSCRKRAKEQGYTLAGIYKDTERYRVKNKLVEPSGWRSDRPAFKQMIADGQAGLFEVIVAWKEDRLYRGLRPMLDLFDALVQDDRVEIELVTETFDKRLASLKASIAQMELSNTRERLMMGRIGNAKQGKLLGGRGILGYDIRDRAGIINELEAETIRFIFGQVAWGDPDYPAGVPIRELRRRLIAKGCHQKTNDHAVPWGRGVIYSILNNKTYLGEMNYHIGGESYPIRFPPIIDQATYDRARSNLSQRKKYRARSARELGFLLMGKLYGPCGHLMHYRVDRYSYYTKVNGTRKRYEREQPLAYGTCSVYWADGPCDFKRVLRLAEIEQATWNQIAPFLLNSENIKTLATEKIASWTENHESNRAELERLEKQAARLQEERRWIITRGRKGLWSDYDMAIQLEAISQEERDARVELAAARQAVEAGAGLLQLVNELAIFLEDYEEELRALAAKPLRGMSLEERRTVQKWFDAVIVRVDLRYNDQIEIQTDSFGLLRSVSRWSTRVKHDGLRQENCVSDKYPT